MPRGKNGGGRDFKKGQVANPYGRAGKDPEMRAIRKMTVDHIHDVIDLILAGNIEKLKEMAMNPEASVLKVWVAKAAVVGIQKGDLHSLEIILNRVLGKPKERVEQLSITAKMNEGDTISRLVSAGDMEAILERKRQLEERKRIAEGRNSFNDTETQSLNPPPPEPSDKQEIVIEETVTIDAEYECKD